MTWRRGPTNPKYRSPEHRRERQRWAFILAQLGVVQCAQPVCVMPTRAIHDGEPWHLGHDESGVRYIGPVHPRCNREAGAQLAHKRRRAQAGRATNWEL